MDVVLRYFNNKSCLVETSYFDSAFLKWPNSHNLRDNPWFREMLQVLMDGPNVNWDVLKIHSSYREENEFSNWHTPRWQLWPSCVIWCPGHRTDGNRLGDQQSFTCNIENIQWITCKERYLYHGNCLWYFFFAFCKTRWVENEPVAAQGIHVWESILQVVKSWLSFSKSKRPHNN